MSEPSGRESTGGWVVTDSAVDAPPGFLPDLPIAQIDVVADATGVFTSRPSPKVFDHIYDCAYMAGARDVVSVHLSGKLSGTVESARIAASRAPLPVTVVDSQSAAMGLGFAVRAAVEAMNAGATAQTAADAARARAWATEIRFVVDSLDALERGGRIGVAARFVGSALSIKPVLALVDGMITPVGKVRTMAKAIDTVCADSLAIVDQLGVADVAVHYVGDDTNARAVVERLSEARPAAINATYVTEVGPVIAHHVGEGLIGVIVAPALSGGAPFPT